MPTIPQLPPASSVLPSDEIPISQGGSVHAVSVGTLLQTAQPVITVQSSTLLGRTSLGAGGPEQVEVGTGLDLAEGVIVADGSDHASYPSTPSLLVDSDLVISNHGSQMLMSAGLLRGLFSGGINVTIDSGGVISTNASGIPSQTIPSGSAIGSLQVVSSVSAQDLVPVSQAGINHAISYTNLLNGLTIDQAPLAGPTADSDVIWVAQVSNVMASQNFRAVWQWISGKIPTYKSPVVEISASTGLDASLHNGRVLVCSQAVTLMPLSAAMVSGFQCQVINVSGGNITLGAGFLTSSGGFTIGSRQAATIQCVTYSGGTVIYASISPSAATVAVPGQVAQLTASNVTATSLTLSWQQPSSGGIPSFYAVQYRRTGLTNWTAISTILAVTSYLLAELQESTSYDIAVQAFNGAGIGAASPILTVSTAVSSQIAPPLQVNGLAAVATSSSSIQLSWSGQTGASGATSYTIQYRVTGSSVWSSTVSAISGSSYNVAGLQPAVSYDFSVYGVNASGAGAVSATTTAAGANNSVPGQVIGLVATGVATASINLSWQQPSSGGAPSSYNVQYRQTGTTTWVTSPTVVAGTTCQLTGLQSSTSYDIQVQASNVNGAGLYSGILTVSTTQLSVPSQVVITHPAPATYFPGRLVDSTNHTVSSTDAPFALAVLTTERKAA